MLEDDPRERLALAGKALCAWYSLPEKKSKTKETDVWKFSTSFGRYSEEFPDLVNSKGEGWFYRHVHEMEQFILKNPTPVRKDSLNWATAIHKGWDKQWQKKVIQMQIPPLAETTVADWLLRFDDVLADALELGPLRTDCPEIPPALLTRLETELPSGVSLEKVKVLVAYYLANRQPDTDWVVLPVTNFDAYFGGETFSKKELSKIPQTIIERKTGYGVCIYRVVNLESEE